MTNFLRSLGFAPETTAGFIRGLWQALIVAVPVGLGLYAAEGLSAAIIASLTAFFLALGGRTLEGAYDARREHELSPLERDALDRMRRGEPFSYDPNA